MIVPQAIIRLLTHLLGDITTAHQLAEIAVLHNLDMEDVATIARVISGEAVSGS